MHQEDEDLLRFWLVDGSPCVLREKMPCLLEGFIERLLSCRSNTRDTNNNIGVAHKMVPEAGW